MEQRYPSLVARLQSSLLDVIFLILLMCVFSLVLEQFKLVPDWVRVFLFGLLFVAYEPLCTSFGFTVGNYPRGIRVRRADDSTKRINIGQAILRYMLKFALCWLSFVTIHGNPQRRAIHDLSAGSVMIKI